MKLALVVFILLLPSLCFGEEVKSTEQSKIKLEKKLTEKEIIQKIRGNVCPNLYGIVSSAFKYKDKGKTKAEMLAPLPTKKILDGYPKNKTKQQWLGYQMLEVMDDIYVPKNLEWASYAAYRSEVCYRSAMNQPTPNNFNLIVDDLVKCGSLNDKEKVDCGIGLAKK